MSENKAIGRVAIIGTGVIGASWTALSLAKGVQVVATDSAPNAEAALRKFVETAWPALKRLGLSPGASQSNLKFTADLAQRQPCPGKRARADRFQTETLWAARRVAAARRHHRIEFVRAHHERNPKGAASHPDRCVIAHPFNPPHLIPLVEIVGGAKTSEATIRRAEEFYTSIGQRTLNKEMPGHVANRLQAASAREVYYLVAEGVVSAADVDTALS